MIDRKLVRMATITIPLALVFIANFAKADADVAPSFFATPSDHDPLTPLFDTAIDTSPESASPYYAAKAPRPPQPIEKTLRFSTLKSYYDNATQTDASFLNGKWITTAAATNTACGFNLTDRTDESGLKNQDGSAFAKLVFENKIIPEVDFKKQVFAVQVHNLGHAAADQGPYAVDPEEPQFATWAYNDGSGMSKTGYYAYHCRAVSGSTDRLICALKLELASPEQAETAARACSASGFGIMLLYKKVK